MYRIILSLFLVIGFFTFQARSQDSTNHSLLRRPTVGLVLSGGGAKGFAYVGLLRVIREAGLPIDYIGGTSIGSVIGALYALGYDPDSIASVIRAQDWDNVLKDNPDRKFKAFEEKEYGEKTIVRIPIRGKKLAISSSMYQGQEIELLLNYYLSPAYKINDFKKLSIPFLCIGTNLFTGEQVVLDHGNLPMAVRASMSIPGYFSPTDYQGYYLVDGGVVNNYPVREVKAMGADIIIGGDVQSGLHQSKEELNSIATVLDQITSFSRTEANRVGDELTDIKIKIPLTYGMMDFVEYDSIMAEGDRVSRKYYPVLKALADSLNGIERRLPLTRSAHPVDSVFVDSLVVTGTTRMPRKYFTSMFPDHGKYYISLNDIRENIRAMYGSGFFDRVTYTLDHNKGKTNLVISASEVGPGALSAGIHFDNDYGVGLILSGSFRNLLLVNSKLYADVNIGLNPRLRIVYLKGFGGKSALGLMTDFYSFDFNLYDGDVKVNRINFTNYKSSMFFQYTFRNMVNMKAGYEFEHFRFAQDVHTDSTLDPYEHFSNYGTAFLSFKADSRDKPAFATRGIMATMRGEYTMPLSRGWVQELFANAAVFYIDYDHYLQIHKRFVLVPGFFTGATLWNKNSPPFQHIFGFGGLNTRNYIEQNIQFTGLRFIQEYGYYAADFRLTLQYNVFRKLYMTPRVDIGACEFDFPEMFEGRNLLAGYGLTAGYDSFIGPVELSLVASNVYPGVQFYVNIGFRL